MKRERECWFALNRRVLGSNDIATAATAARERDTHRERETGRERKKTRARERKERECVCVESCAGESRAHTIVLCSNTK